MADFLSVAAAERAWLSSELNIISTRQNIRIKLAQLCTALGGGWKVQPEQK
jgi:outer membrane protein TolC